MVTEREIIEQLRQGEISLPPLSIRLLEHKIEAVGEGRLDAVIQVSWREHAASFAVEIKSRSTPRTFRDGLNWLKLTALPEGYRPMLIMPYLREGHLQVLEKDGISGLDLCGNGVVMVPDAFAVFRSGAKNRFSISAPIKNIYRKKSSMVGRAFLARPTYDAVREVHAEINQRNLLLNSWHQRPLSLSTVSKALKTLAEDLIVERNGSIRLLQPDILLQKLRENYTPPRIRERFRLKLPEASGPVQEWLEARAEALNLPMVATGTSSVNQYAVMQRGDPLSVYCPRLKTLLEHLPISAPVRFPNLELIETEEETVYFDARQDGKFRWASPVQVYLELMAGDKRDQETADQVKSFILTNLGLALQ